LIYTIEECDAIRNIKERKELERSIYSSMDSLPIAVRTSMDCQFELDIQRCDSMVRIGHNDFSNVEEDVQILSPHPI